MPRPKILIVDCHEDVLIALENLFENNGFDTTTAWTAGDAMRLLDLVAFDLVLLNEYLSEGPAEEVLRAMRRRGIGTPCMILQPSAPPMLDSRSFRSLGVVGIACKHQAVELLEKVRDHLDSVRLRRELERVPA
jgi:DNA-binding response OmpR family regulator